MKYFVAIILMCLFIACTEQKIKPLYVADQKPKKIASYPVQKGSQILGYAHKYEWESKRGDFQHFYFLYNALGDMIGYIGETGETEVYFPSGEKRYLGINTQEEAASKVFETQEKFFDIPGKIRIVSSDYDGENRTIVISSRGDSFSPSTVKKSKPKYLKNSEEKSNVEEVEKEEEKHEEEEQEEWPESSEKWPGEN